MGKVNRRLRKDLAALKVNDVNGNIAELDELDESCLPQLAEAIETVKVKIVEWKCVSFSALPNWLKDNEYLLNGHRPPLYSAKECFKSIFRLHTETGNIWSHLIGCASFILITLHFLTRPSLEIDLREKLVFTTFFIGAILCLGFSTVFHTLSCHSETVLRRFGKLDYVGISLLIMGSTFPWIYYAFYCKRDLQLIYMSKTFVFGFASILASMSDKFGTPKYRPLRAALFAVFGVSGAIPAFHYAFAKGWTHVAEEIPAGWLILMAFLYLFGAFLYAMRIPERFFPGKCDYWFQSHQIFHLLVVAAALVNFRGISLLAVYRLENKCEQV